MLVAAFVNMLHPKIDTHERKTTSPLKVIGLIGGFTNVMKRIFGIIGTYFSDKFYKQRMISQLYLTKKKKKPKTFEELNDPSRKQD